MALPLLMYATRKRPVKDTGMPHLLKPGILIISDTTATDTVTDHAGPLLSAQLTGFKTPAGQYLWDRPVIEFVPNIASVIQTQLKKWADEQKLDLILTSGGIGFTPEDRTPEAVQPFLSKEAPGIVHAMLSASSKTDPLSMLSRPVAGVHGKTIVITLPSSSNAAREDLETVLDYLTHGLIFGFCEYVE